MASLFCILEDKVIDDHPEASVDLLGSCKDIINEDFPLPLEEKTTNTGKNGSNDILDMIENIKL